MQTTVNLNEGTQTTAQTEDAKTKKLKTILKELNMVSSDIEASAVISSDGLVKTAILGDTIDPGRFGAMCATLLALSKRAAMETARGDLRLVLIEGSNGTMLIVQIGDKGVLALAAKPKSNLGMIFLKAKNTAKLIEEIM